MIHSPREARSRKTRALPAALAVFACFLSLASCRGRAGKASPPASPVPAEEGTEEPENGEYVQTEEELRAYISANEAPLPVTLLASSTLPDDPGARPPLSERRIRYSPYNILDDDPRTAWAEAAKGPGKGETVTFCFDFMRFPDAEIRIEAIRVMSGYFDEKFFKANNRVRRLSLRAEGSEPVAVDLADGMTEQLATLSAPLVIDARNDEITLTIEDVYRGDKYDDTCLSGISFLCDGIPLPLDLPARVGYEGGRYPLRSFDGEKSLNVVVEDPVFVFNLNQDGKLAGYKEASIATDSAYGSWDYDEAEGVFVATFTYVQILEYSIEGSKTKDYEFDRVRLYPLGSGCAESAFRGNRSGYGYSGDYIAGLPEAPSD